METLNIPLSPSEKAFVDAQVAAGGFPSAVEYITQLIHQAEIKKERERIDGLLLEAVQSGESTPMTTQNWEDIRSEVKECLSRPKRRRQKK